MPAIRYRKNELFILIQEKLNCSILNQSILTNITGTINLLSYLSYSPSIDIQFTDYMLSAPTFISEKQHPLTSLTFLPFDDIEISLHQNVTFHSTSPFLINIEFLDGEYSLMKYNVTKYSSNLSKIFTVTVDIESSRDLNEDIYHVTLHTIYNLQNVVLKLPIQQDSTIFNILSVECMIGCGSARILFETDSIEWKISNIYINKSYHLFIKIKWNNINENNDNKIMSDKLNVNKRLIKSPIQGNFEINNLLSNRMKLDWIKLKVKQKEYKYFVHMRNLTSAENYDIPIRYKSY